MNVNYKLEEIHPKVFLVTIDGAYDLAMTFCRVQEFYESSFKEIRGKYFNMTEFQRMYSIKYGDGCFTYPHDWAGFNVPSYIIDKCYGYEKSFNDINQYDDIIQEIDHKITNSDINAPKYYLIGSQPKAKRTIAHEVAHAFYYLYPKYKKTANQITNEISEKNKNKIKKWLLSIGYNDKVFKDELQAYMTADLDRMIECAETSKKETKNLERISKELQNLNNDYKNRKV
jgi:hypothetical protein